MDRLERIRRLRDSYESALDDAERIRDECHREIVKLHRSGMSLREIAEGLGISHQRVHQIVSPHEEKPRSRARRAAAGGTVAALVLIVGTAIMLSRGTPKPPPARTTPSTEPPIGTCAVGTGSGSTFATITLAAACSQRLTEAGAVIVLDPATGEVPAICGDAGTRSLRDLLARICDGPPCRQWS